MKNRTPNHDAARRWALEVIEAYEKYHAPAGCALPTHVNLAIAYLARDALGHDTGALPLLTGEHLGTSTTPSEPAPTDIDHNMLEWAAEMGCEMEADDRHDYDPKVCSPDHTGRCWPCEARVRLAESAPTPEDGEDGREATYVDEGLLFCEDEGRRKVTRPVPVVIAALTDAGHLPLGPAPTPTGCLVNMLSSRMCERGTKGCTIPHGPAPTPGAELTEGDRVALLSALRTAGIQTTTITLEAALIGRASMRSPEPTPYRCQLHDAAGCPLCTMDGPAPVPTLPEGWRVTVDLPGRIRMVHEDGWTCAAERDHDAGDNVCAEAADPGAMLYAMHRAGLLPASRPADETRDRQTLTKGRDEALAAVVAMLRCDRREYQQSMRGFVDGIVRQLLAGKHVPFLCGGEPDGAHREDETDGG